MLLGWAGVVEVFNVMLSIILPRGSCAASKDILSLSFFLQCTLEVLFSVAMPHQAKGHPDNC
jgi:hypothetical protein